MLNQFGGEGWNGGNEQQRTQVFQWLRNIYGHIQFIPICIQKNEESIDQLCCILMLSVKLIMHSGIMTAFEIMTNVHLGIPMWA